MKKGEITAVIIDRLDSDGIGMGVLDGRTIKVPGTCPGDTVRAVVTTIKRATARARLQTIETPGIGRIPPPCPHFAVCGGCRWQDIPYPEQLSLKSGMLRDALSRSGEGSVSRDVPVQPSPEIFHYRNKMEFSFDQPPESGTLSLGLHEAGKFNRVFDITGCLLESPQSNRIVAEARRFAVEHGLTACGLKSHRGLLKYLVIREGKATGETMVNLVTSGEEFPVPERFASRLRETIPGISTILWSVNKSTSGVATGGERRVLAGNGCIHDRIGSFGYEISPDSFFQTNTGQAVQLYETIGEFAKLTGGERVLDLYCGTGTIGIFLAGLAKSVLGIEISEEAVRDAGKNAVLNGIGNIEFVAGKVESTIREGMGLFEVVVCDPPRAGIHPRAMDQLVRMRIPRMVYVSCNVAALPNDLEVLRLAGYRVADIRAFDMSPHTPHIETVVLLEL